MRSLNIEYIEKFTINSGDCKIIFSSSTIIEWRKLNFNVNISVLFQENILEIMLNIWKTAQLIWFHHIKMLVFA